MRNLILIFIISVNVLSIKAQITDTISSKHLSFTETISLNGKELQLNCICYFDSTKSRISTFPIIDGQYCELWIKEYLTAFFLDTIKQEYFNRDSTCQDILVAKLYKVNDKKWIKMKYNFSGQLIQTVNLIYDRIDKKYSGIAFDEEGREAHRIIKTHIFKEETIK